MKKVIIGLLLCSLVTAMLSGCRVNISIGTNDTLTGETYSDAEKYQTGAFTYNAADIKAVEVYWRSGEVEITESDNSELHVKESGGELPEDTAMHYLLGDGVLRIRFCKSGAIIQVNATDKHLSLEVPKGIDLSVHTTSALVKADSLNQNNISIAALSGHTELGTVTADTVDLSSSSGSIRADSLSAQSLKCSTSSGSVTLGVVSAQALNCGTSSGSVRIDNLRVETAAVATSSGSVKLTILEAAEATVRTSSGGVCVTLPNAGAEVLLATSSGKLHTNRTFERKGDLYVFGSGTSRLSVETASGGLEIR